MKTLRYLPIVLVIFLWGCFPEPGVVQPELCFDVEVVQCSPGESEHVEVSTCVNEGDTYIWDWGDGVTEKGPSLSHVYASSGTYTITLTVTNQRGGRVTQSQRVAINKIKFEKIFPAAGVGGGNSLLYTDDGGFLILGTTEALGAGGKDIYLVKTDASGEKLWEKTFGGSNDDIGKSMIKTSDGGIAIIGYTQGVGLQTQGLLFTKLDKDGSFLWNQTYEGFYNNSPYKFIETVDEGYAFLGRASGGDFLLKIHSSGAILWKKVFETSDYTSGLDVVQMLDGSYAILGYHVTPGTASSNTTYLNFILKTDSVGNVIWGKDVGWSCPCLMYKGIHVYNEGYVLFGYGDNGDYTLYKTNQNGEKKWQKEYGGRNREEAMKMVQIEDGGLALIGSTKDQATRESDIYLVQVKANGDLISEKTYGGPGDDIGYSIVATDNCGLAFLGTKAGKDDFWLLRIDAEGDFE